MKRRTNSFCSNLISFTWTLMLKLRSVVSNITLRKHLKIEFMQCFMWRFSYKMFIKTLTFTRARTIQMSNAKFGVIFRRNFGSLCLQKWISKYPKTVFRLWKIDCSCLTQFSEFRNRSFLILLKFSVIGKTSLTLRNRFGEVKFSNAVVWRTS